MNVRLDQFVSAARDRLAAADTVLGKTGGRPQVACYLIHVATECVLKARILATAGTPRLELLRQRMPEKRFAEFFEGSSGHRLGALANYVGIARFAAAEGKPEAVPTGQVWSRMCSADRPYSLRYGVEEVSRDQALAEIDLAQKLASLIISKIPGQG